MLVRLNVFSKNKLLANRIVLNTVRWKTMLRNSRARSRMWGWKDVGDNCREKKSIGKSKHSQKPHSHLQIIYGSRKLFTFRLVWGSEYAKMLCDILLPAQRQRHSHLPNKKLGPENEKKYMGTAQPFLVTHVIAHTCDGADSQRRWVWMVPAACRCWMSLCAYMFHILYLFVRE